MVENKSGKTAIEELEAIYNQNKQNKSAEVQTQTLPPIKELPMPQPAPQVSVPVQEEPSAPLSFDGVVTKVLQRKMTQIDQEAAAKKKRVEEQFYEKLYSLIDSVSADTPVQYQTPQQQVVIPQAAPVQLPVSSQVVKPPAQKNKKVISFKTKFFLGITLSAIIGSSIIILLIRLFSGLGAA